MGKFPYVRILGISKVERGRVYLPKSVRERLGPSVTAYVSGGRVVVAEGSGSQVDGRGRVSLGRKILEYLGVEKGDMVVFLEKGRKIYLAKADRVNAEIE